MAINTMILHAFTNTKGKTVTVATVLNNVTGFCHISHTIKEQS